MGDSSKLPSLLRLAAIKILTALPPRLSLSLHFLWRQGRWPNLRRPKTFTEKVQARKLLPPDPRFAQLADKVLAKVFVAETLGEAWVIQTLWHGPVLPPVNERDWPTPYVIKANHGSGWNIFVRSEDDKNWPEIEQKCQDWMNSRFHPHLHETFYDEIDRQILVEPFIGSEVLPVDYKFFCFDGVAHFVMVQSDRAVGLKIATMSRDWVKQPLRYTFPIPDGDIPKPKNYDTLLAAAEVLSKNFDFVRVDFYEIDGRPLFGEFTFAPGSGYEVFEPHRFNHIFGDLWPNREFASR